MTLGDQNWEKINGQLIIRSKLNGIQSVKLRIVDIQIMFRLEEVTIRVIKPTQSYLAKWIRRKLKMYLLKFLKSHCGGHKTCPNKATSEHIKS